MAKWALGIAGLVLIGVAAWFLGSAGANPTNSPDSSSGDKRNEAQDFDRAPVFTLEDYNGREVSLSDFAGTVRVVNAWATWCPFCVDELPDFAELQREFGDEIVVIAIDRAEPKEQAKKFTDRLGVTDELVFLLDPSDSFYKSIGGFSMPETLFIDQDGNIRIHKRGPMEPEEMREKVQQILQST